MSRSGKVEMEGGTGSASRGGCRRCGTCCRLGGPVLHGEDLARVLPLGEKGVEGFGLADLLTLRKGELARDDVAGTLTPLEVECVKIAPPAGAADWRCRFLDRETEGPFRQNALCRIHSRRPAQCRALLCTDTRNIAALYARDRVTREDLLRAVDAPLAWREVPEAHEESCSLKIVTDLAREVPEGDTPCREADELMRLLRFDEAFRRLCVERGHVPPEYLPFLLGRPLVALLAGFGLRLERQSHVQRLVRFGPGRYGATGSLC